MLHKLKRHPFAVETNFEYVLVLTYAWPSELLKPLLPPGLMLDTKEHEGFVAIALVQTRRLRPAGWPKALGRDYFLSGYRIFTRYLTKEGRSLRGLRILRSETDSPLMRFFGNRLTHYDYRSASVSCLRRQGCLQLDISSRDGGGDLEVSAELAGFSRLPEGSPFQSESEARRYAGPLPYTFDYEKETHSIIRIEGRRREWKPRMVPVQVGRASFFEQKPFQGLRLRLASCFYLENIPYLWKKGIREPL